MQDRADKICEMANIMQKSIQIDEENIAKEHETMARLITENRVRKIRHGNRDHETSSIEGAWSALLHIYLC